jgi:hypothetical protein
VNTYVDQYLKRSSFGLLMLDLWIIWRGILVVVEGGALRCNARARFKVQGSSGKLGQRREDHRE